jgi:chromosome segregation ATPase
MDEWKEKCFAIQGRNDVLSEKLLACETRVRELEEFRTRYQNVWGALTADELIMFAHADKELLEHSPARFMERNHDAIFNRKIIEENKERYGVEMDRMSKNLEIAKASVPALEEEVAALKRRLTDQKQQTAIQLQRVESLEQELAVDQYQLKLGEVQWMKAGENIKALERSVERLTAENESMKARVSRVIARVPVEPLVVQNGPVCMQVDVDSVAVSLYARIKELQAKCHAKQKKQSTLSGT